jgi:hypothetical protein
VDLTLTITRTLKAGDRHHYVARGSFCGDPVGLQIELVSMLPAGLAESGGPTNAGFLPDAVRWRSIGAESDAFLNALAELYEHPAPGAPMRDLVRPSAFSLNAYPVDLSKPATGRFKLFFEGDDAYAELFMNIDTAAGIIQLNEKDPDYRTALLTLLRQG